MVGFLLLGGGWGLGATRVPNGYPLPNGRGELERRMPKYKGSEDKKGGHTQ